jgi:hypothetical protein
VGVSKTEINSIWGNLGRRSNPALEDNQIGGPFSSFNDTLDYSADGLEADMCDERDEAAAADGQLRPAQDEAGQREPGPDRVLQQANLAAVAGRR